MLKLQSANALMLEELTFCRFYNSLPGPWAGHKVIMDISYRLLGELITLYSFDHHQLIPWSSQLVGNFLDVPVSRRFEP